MANTNNQEKKQQLTGGRELNYLRQKDALQGSLFQKIINAVNNLANSASVSAVGKLSAPPPVDSVDVHGTFDADTNTITAPDNILHFTMTHNQAIKKGVQYISEIDTDPNFTQPHIVDHGCSRSGFVSLPATSDGTSKNAYYLRTYAQYHGSDPSAPTVVGGQAGATKIILGGTSQGSLLASKGSGTASPTGTQGGKGLGTILNRPAPGPKRNLQA